MSATMGAVFAHVARDPIQLDELARDRLRRAAVGATRCASAPVPAELRALAGASAGRLRRARCAAATSSPTTARRSSG